jgi:hypothetical protein
LGQGLARLVGKGMEARGLVGGNLGRMLRLWREAGHMLQPLQ